MKRKMGKNESGFTLLEVVAVLALAGVVTTVVANAFLQSTYTQQNLSGRFTALFLGESKLNELISEAETCSSGEFAKPYSEKYKWYCESESGENGMTVVVLTVEWSGRDGTRRQKVFKQSYFTQ